MTKGQIFRIRWIMRRYNREEGYVTIIDGRAYFFDSKPVMDSFHVKKEDLDKTIKRIRHGKAKENKG